MDMAKERLDFGKRLKAIRKQRGMRQIDLSDALAISKDSVTRWENGLREPSAGGLKQLASILGISVAFLLGETDDPLQRETDAYAKKLETRRVPEVTLGKEGMAILSKQASLEDFARVRETSRNVSSLDEHDLKAAEEMLLASLKAIRVEKAVRGTRRSRSAKSA
jgi:transcriptional regulator with XRE-family HTH domain